MLLLFDKMLESFDQCGFFSYVQGVTQAIRIVKPCQCGNKNEQTDTSIR